MLKRSISVVISVVVASMALTGCGGSAGSSAKGSGGSEIKVGCVIPMSGAAASYGKSCKLGLDMLTKEVNAKGGILGKKVTIEYQDEESKPQTAANAVQKLVNSEKVCAIIGSMNSGPSLAMGPICTAAKVPMISPMATNEAVTTKGGDYVFRACFIDPFQGKVGAKFAATNLKAKTAAVLYDVGNDYAKGLAEVFKKEFPNNGGTIVDSETYNTGDTDFNAQLTKIKAKNPDVLYLSDFYTTVALIAKQARNDGIKSTFMGGDGWDSPDLFKIGGTAVNGAYFSDHYSPTDTSPEVVQFIKDFKSQYNSTPDASAALGYDSGNILFAAIKKAGSTDGTKIKDALAQTNGKFVSGQITFDKDRNPVKAAVIITAKDGKFDFVTKVNP